MVQRLERPCTWCGRGTTSKYGTCIGCRSLVGGAPAVTNPAYALTGGTWRPGRGGVLHWHPNDEQRSA